MMTTFFLREGRFMMGKKSNMEMYVLLGDGNSIMERDFMMRTKIVRRKRFHYNKEVRRLFFYEKEGRL